CFG
ncbi:citrate transporter family protein, partial [Vibrio parahaemolyticus V-223/04]